MEFYSCDTMVALGNSTRSGNILFAKNSDRPVNEAQPLVQFEAADHAPGEEVKCTYITIPQVAHTYRVMGSKPYWLWGFEHGMNEHKVVIGNEAVWSREEEEKENGLLGMDLLRLGLERGKTAYEAMHVIIALLEQYGQGGSAAVGKAFHYHNTFLLADPTEAWILDTVNRRWVARRVKDVAGISNCYSTTTEWDEASPDLKEHAYEMGWYPRELPFDFAKAYSAMSAKHRAAHPRWMRLNKLLCQAKGDITRETLQKIQRDHFEGELIEPRFSPADGLHVSICMHSIDPDASKTAAAAVVELTPDKPLVWFNALSSPCASVYVPCYIEGELPHSLSKAGAKFSEDSLWWKFERLNYKIEEDYPRFIGTVRSVWDKLEKEMAEKADASRPAQELTNAMMQDWKVVEEQVDRLYAQLESDDQTCTQPQRIPYLKKARQEAGIE
ncbi:C69 family dipeptidase [uncultured Ruthenibacterium sp.]|uniref:C69 family dipeptidase n=1 Tax=uncultured Ruthenibacterium sp. TaxID=1905347 RepID=UPI00349E8BB9